MPQPIILKSIRKEIYENTEKYKKIINDKKFKSYFPEVWGEQLKLAPGGFPKDFKDIDLLKNKHYVVTHNVDNSFWLDKKLIDDIIAVFHTQYEFNKFLNNAISKTQ